MHRCGSRKCPTNCSRNGSNMPTNASLWGLPPYSIFHDEPRSWRVEAEGWHFGQAARVAALTHQRKC